jgi:hypothetical protein
MAALGVVEMVDENMANAARPCHRSGKGYEGRAIIAFGGGGRCMATAWPRRSAWTGCWCRRAPASARHRLPPRAGRV